MKRRLLSIFMLIVLFFTGGVAFTACKKSEKAGCRYEIKVEYEPGNRKLFGSQKVLFVNTTDNCIDEIKFNLFPNAYREGAVHSPISKSLEQSAYYDKKSYGGIEITSVVGAKGFEIAGEDKNVLAIALDAPLFPDEKVTLDIGFITLLAQVNHRTGITQKSVNLGNFYPILCAYQDGFLEYPYSSIGDAFTSGYADYDVSIVLPKEYAAATSGVLLDERVLESKKVCRYQAENVRDFAAVLSTNFRLETRRVGTTDVGFYLFSNEENSAIDTVLSAFEYFNGLFGAYPYPTYSFVQTEICLGGAEYPALSMFSFNQKESKEEKAFRIVREVAKQWWYAAVGNNQAIDGWIDEGLAEYSAILFFEKHAEYGLKRAELVNARLLEYRTYFDGYNAFEKKTDTSMTRRLETYETEYEYRLIARNKSAVMFDLLRDGIGEKRFFSGLKRYYKENKFRLVTANDMIVCFEKSGVDVSGFFDGFLSGKAIL